MNAFHFLLYSYCVLFALRLRRGKFGISLLHSTCVWELRVAYWMLEKLCHHYIDSIFLLLFYGPLLCQPLYLTVNNIKK